ncbi:dead deah box rna [Phytophthora cinnamomi]|uniref:dead deah box rna n=1 Tax=Phytophthora cinnamomi TaxID=4785 RepID=UPI00355A922E|nr:dead deah box rna [Phytophthora cinnamomi]
MATVLQRIKDKRLTPAQECESRVIFELAAEGSEAMTVKQLKRCLRALGFSVAKGEAQVLVYEFDYTDTSTIDLADFQKIFLSKVLESSEQELFDQAFRAISSCGKVSTRELSSALHATRSLGHHPTGDPPGGRAIDGAALRNQMDLQHYDEADAEAMQEFLDDTAELRVPKAALAAFLRVHA